MSDTLDCALCLLRQSLEAARFASSDETVQRKILEKAMREELERGIDSDPPRLGTILHRIVRETTGDPDPYYNEKRRFNKTAMERLDLVRRWIEESEDRFETTVRFAIAGNSIDMALGVLDEKQIESAIHKAIDQPFVGSFEELRSAIDDAKTILYLTDNAGEIVYDRLFVELLTSEEFRKEVLVVVRGKPILNDALLEDAEEVGLTKLVPVIGNGGDGLGVIFSLTSPEFNDKFASADLVIAKGLANYETLGYGEQEIVPKRIAFLFKAKCAFIARRIGARLGDLVSILKSDPTREIR